MSESAGKTQNEEIDLLDLFKRFGGALKRFFTAIWTGILVTFVFLARNFLILTLSILLGTGLSYLFKFSFQQVFKGDMVLKTNTVPASEMISFINRLHVYCQEKNLALLAKSLSVSPQEALKVKDIEAFWIIDRNRDNIADYVDYGKSHDVYDTVDVRMPDRLDVQIKVISNPEVTTIRTGVLKFIESDSIFREKNKVRLKQNEDMLKRLSYDIEQLDSLQKVKYFEESRNHVPKTSGQIVFLQEQKTQLVYTDIYGLYSKKQAIESEQILNRKIVSLISDITIPYKPLTGALYYGKVIIPLLFSITLLTLIVVRNRKRLKDTFEQY